MAVLIWWPDCKVLKSSQSSPWNQADDEVKPHGWNPMKTRSPPPAAEAMASASSV
ncbi:MAG TPA: hypothetical protein VF984_10380 [Actinomycetota bacterium]